MFLERIDQKGVGGVVIYVKECFETTMLLSESIAKQHELLALNLSASKTCQLTIVGCYRPPSATSNTLTSLMNSLASLNYKELILMGDFNLNWLLPVSSGFKAFCDTYNLFHDPVLLDLCYLQHLLKSIMILFF